MSKIIAISNHKGGVGKSTISTNLAAILAANNNVLLVDHDTSKTSLKFCNRREHSIVKVPKINVFVPKDADEIEELLEIDMLGSSNGVPAKPLDYKVIDMGGFTDDMARAGLIYADLVVIPTSISSQDMDGNIHFMNKIDEIRKLGAEINAVFAVNNTDPRTKRPRIERELEYIIDRGYKVLSTVPHYAAFSDSHGMGMSMSEFDENSKAAAYMQQLVEDILQEIEDAEDK